MAAPGQNLAETDHCRPIHTVSLSGTLTRSTAVDALQ